VAGRKLNGWMVITGAGIVLALLVVILVLGRIRNGLSGAAVNQLSAQAAIDQVYGQLSTKLNQKVTADNSTYVWLLGPYPDSSMGCPQPGQTYQQGVVYAYDITINFASNAYDYRVKADNSLTVFCSSSPAPDNAQATTQAIVEPVALVDAALSDLSTRLGQTFDRPNTHYHYTWSLYPDGSLGCAVQGQTYASGATWGWDILLQPNAGGTYDYRGLDAGNFWYCQK